MYLMGTNVKQCRGCQRSQLENKASMLECVSTGMVLLFSLRVPRYVAEFAWIRSLPIGAIEGDVVVTVIDHQANSI